MESLSSYGYFTEIIEEGIKYGFLEFRLLVERHLNYIFYIFFTGESYLVSSRQSKYVQFSHSIVNTLSVAIIFLLNKRSLNKLKYSE